MGKMPLKAQSFCGVYTLSKKNLQLYLNGSMLCYFHIISFENMPYIYPIEVRESALEGKGLFAAAGIPKGTLYWVCCSDDPSFTKFPCVPENRSFTCEEL